MVYSKPTIQAIWNDFHIIFVFTKTKKNLSHHTVLLLLQEKDAWLLIGGMGTSDKKNDFEK